MLKQDYKDEIATRRYQVVDNKTGAIINPDVALKRIDTPTQIGDRFMARILNEITKRLNDLESGVEVVDTATNASNAPKGLNVGSPEEPKKVVQWWLDADRKMSMYGNENGFSIQLKKANGELIHTLLSANKDGISLVDNSRELGGQPSSYYAKQADLNSIKNGAIQVGNTAKFGGQLPAYYALASQFQDISKIRRYQVTVNPGGKDFFDVARGANEFIIPLHASNGIIITGMQYASASVRILMRDYASINITFYYMIVYA